MQNNLLIWRLSKSLSQTKLARAVGVSQQAISQWENGQKSPKSKYILKLAEALEVTSDEILNSIRSIQTK